MGNLSKSRFPKMAELEAAFPDYLIMMRASTWYFIERRVVGTSYARARRAISKMLAISCILGWKEYIKLELEKAKEMAVCADINICKQDETSIEGKP